MTVYRTLQGGVWTARAVRSLRAGAWKDTAGTATPVSAVANPRPQIIAALDPANYGAKVYTVPNTAGTSIQDTMNTAAAASTALARSLVVIPSGTYNQRVSVPNGWVDVRSSTLIPADVIIAGPDNVDDTWEHNGFGGILAGVTLRNYFGKSTIHSGQGSRDEEFIYYKVLTDTTTNAALSFGVCPGQGIYLYDCTLSASNESPIYIHNFPAVAKPAVAVFDNVTGFSGRGSGFAFSIFLEENSGQADKFYWHGGSISGAGGVIGFAYLAPATAPGSWSGQTDKPSQFSIAAGIDIQGVSTAQPPLPLRFA